MSDPVDDAYNTLPCGHPEPRPPDGSHDRYPHMNNDIRQIVTAYCERIWNLPTTHEREYPL